MVYEVYPINPRTVDLERLREGIVDAINEGAVDITMPIFLEGTERLVSYLNSQGYHATVRATIGGSDLEEVAAGCVTRGQMTVVPFGESREIKPTEPQRGE